MTTHLANPAVALYTAVITGLCFVFAVLQFGAACADGLNPRQRGVRIIGALGLLAVGPISFAVTFIF